MMSERFIKWFLILYDSYVIILATLITSAIVISVMRMVIRRRRRFRNRNRRIYPESTMREAVEKFNKNNQYGTFYGEIQHPEAGPLRIEDESVKVVMKIQSVEVIKDNKFRRFFGFRSK